MTLKTGCKPDSDVKNLSTDCVTNKQEQNQSTRKNILSYSHTFTSLHTKEACFTQPYTIKK